MDVDIVNTIHADLNKPVNGREIQRSSSKEQNTLIIHCTLAVLYAERRGNHSFHFHMGNSSVLFLHSALAHVTLVPPKQKNPPCLVINWQLAGVVLFKLFCFLFGWHGMDLQLNAVVDQSLQSTFEDSKQIQSIKAFEAN